MYAGSSRPALHCLVHLDTTGFIYAGFSYASMVMPVPHSGFPKPVDLQSGQHNLYL
jgi:hypothetical protein